MTFTMSASATDLHCQAQMYAYTWAIWVDGDEIPTQEAI